MNSLAVPFGLSSSFILTIDSVSVLLTHLFLGVLHSLLCWPWFTMSSLPSVMKFPEHSLPQNFYIPLFLSVCKLAASLLSSYLLQCYVFSSSLALLPLPPGTYTSSLPFSFSFSSILSLVIVKHSSLLVFALLQNQSSACLFVPAAAFATLLLYAATPCSPLRSEKQSIASDGSVKASPNILK